jgi:pyridoxine 5-phosphate synthase
MRPGRTLLLGVNIDHIATIRQARGTRYPDPVQAAILAEEAGADAITMHLREDRRHIQERDVRLVMETKQTRLNLEMAVTDEMVSIAEAIQPEDCCLVPERREELTTEGGLNVRSNVKAITNATERLAKAGTRVSLFIDANRNQIDAAVDTGAPVIEIHTGHFADAVSPGQSQDELARIIEAVEYAHGQGLHVNAGHGLHYHNVEVIAAIEAIEELNIGHAIVARALFTGLAQAVKDMKRLMNQVPL